ncbi:MAG: UPF0182 family protein, partial [Gemmatimonadales bacterium]
QIAFGLTALENRAPPAFATPEAALRRLPIWDAGRVADVAGVPPAAVALRPSDGGERASWLVAPVSPTTGSAPSPRPATPATPAGVAAAGTAQAWTAGAPATLRVAVETDTGLVVSGVTAADSAVWFAPGIRAIAVASPDTAPAVRTAGIVLAGAWRRAALAWTLQSAALARSETDGQVLLWRRDVEERLSRLAPFATFGRPAPATVDGALWWVSWGYVRGDAFPLVRPLPWRDGTARYFRAGILGAVRAATGETHVWLAPGHDSLTAAWARHFVPLIEPEAAIPARLRSGIPYPDEAFGIAVAQLLRARDDSTLVTRPRAPFQVIAPAARPELWMAVGLESGRPPHFDGLVAGTVAPDGPRLTLWRPAAATRLPGELLGSSAVRPGELRLWLGGRALVTVQAQFVHPIGAEAPLPHEVAQVYVSVGERIGHGPTVDAALRGEVPVDTSLAARWDRARRLITRADSALTAGDLELFGRLFRELVRQLAPGLEPR